MYAERGCRRGEYPGRGRATQCIAAARGAVESNVIVYARRNQQLARLPPRWGGHGGISGAVCNNEPNRSQRTTRTSIRRRSISGDQPIDQLFLLKPSGEAHRVGRKRQALSTPSTGEPPEGGFPVLIHTNPNNPIRHSATQPDCNCRCNPDRCLNVRTRFFPPNLLMAGPVERAPV